MQKGLLSAGKEQPTKTPDSAATAEGEPEPNVTPEEQEQYNQFVLNGRQLIHSEKTLPGLLEALEGDGNPVEGLSNALVTVVMRLEDSAEKSGTEIPGDVKFHGATELMAYLVELANEAGIGPISDEDQENALYLALDTYRATRQEQGKLPMDEINADMEAIMQADQQGRLDEILPGVTGKSFNTPDEAGNAQQKPKKGGLLRQA